MHEALLLVAIKNAPAVIALIKDAFRREHPDAPTPTDAEVIKAEVSAFLSSMAKDDAWLAAHPE